MTRRVIVHQTTAGWVADDLHYGIRRRYRTAAAVVRAVNRQDRAAAALDGGAHVTTITWHTIDWAGTAAVNALG